MEEFLMKIEETFAYKNLSFILNEHKKVIPYEPGSHEKLDAIRAAKVRKEYANGRRNIRGFITAREFDKQVYRGKRFEVGPSYQRIKTIPDGTELVMILLLLNLRELNLLHT